MNEFGCTLKQAIPRLAFFLGLIALVACAQSLYAEPKLVSIAPLGAAQGTTIEVEVQGSGLEGASVVWLGTASQFTDPQSESERGHTSCEGVDAHITAVTAGSQARLQLTIAADARIGFHELGLISPSGLSSPLAFWIGPPDVLPETAATHDSPETARPMNVPITVNGRLTKSRQLAYYTFTSEREQTLAFEIVALAGANFDAQVALFEAEASYLDARRLKRLIFHEELTQGGMPASRRMTFPCTHRRYVVQVGNVFAQGGDFSYLLRIWPAAEATAAEATAAEDALAWANRRLQQLRSHSIAPPAIELAQAQEKEPNDTPETAQTFTMPAVLSGTIGHANDIDCFKFNAAAGLQLALESQTPDACPPRFNLRLDVLDAKGAVVLSNLQEHDVKIGTADAKAVRFITVPAATLADAGEYVVRVRDLTSIHGSPDHAYRVLVRRQLPHVGNIQVEPAGPVNLAPGGVRRWTLAAEAKEGFAGSLAYSVDGLPTGVHAFVGANQIELRADATTPVTSRPNLLRISGVPVAGGNSGSPFAIMECALMMVKQ